MIGTLFALSMFALVIFGAIAFLVKLFSDYKLKGGFKKLKEDDPKRKFVTRKQAGSQGDGSFSRGYSEPNQRPQSSGLLPISEPSNNQQRSGGVGENSNSIRDLFKKIRDGKG